MKHLQRIARLFVLAGIMVMAACSSSDDDDTTFGDWIKSTPFKGVKRSGAFSFTIGTTAYVGLGYDGKDYLSDVYKFDATKGYWEVVTAFPGALRERCVSFSINGIGYVGLGYNRDDAEDGWDDFWQYDPAADQWTQLASFGGGVRYNAVSFAIGSKGYVGTGSDGHNTFSDFWEFTPGATPEEGEWNEVVSYPGEKMEAGLAFVLNNKAYIGTGRDNGIFSSGFWEFAPGTDGGIPTWTKRTPATDESDYDEFQSAMSRYDAVALTLGNKAYLVGGVASSGATDKSVYEFDATTFNWDNLTSLEGSARSLAVGYVLDGRLFVGTGLNGSSRFDDVWEFFPQKEYDEEY
jgi:N-acetylneuraminic acid mutarotase